MDDNWLWGLGGLGIGILGGVLGTLLLTDGKDQGSGLPIDTPVKMVNHPLVDRRLLEWAYSLANSWPHKAGVYGNSETAWRGDLWIPGSEDFLRIHIGIQEYDRQKMERVAPYFEVEIVSTSDKPSKEKRVITSPSQMELDDLRDRFLNNTLLNDFTYIRP